MQFADDFQNAPPNSIIQRSKAISITFKPPDRRRLKALSMNNPQEAALLNPMFWRLFLPTLSCGTDPDYDTKMIHSYCEATKIPVAVVMKKMRVFCHRGNYMLN